MENCTRGALGAAARCRRHSGACLDAEELAALGDDGDLEALCRALAVDENENADGDENEGGGADAFEALCRALASDCGGA